MSDNCWFGQKWYSHKESVGFVNSIGPTFYIIKLKWICKSPPFLYVCDWTPFDSILKPSRSISIQPCDYLYIHFLRTWNPKTCCWLASKKGQQWSWQTSGSQLKFKQNNKHGLVSILSVVVSVRSFLEIILIKAM